jgi:hypothetical protein
MMKLIGKGRAKYAPEVPLIGIVSWAGIHQKEVRPCKVYIRKRRDLARYTSERGETLQGIHQKEVRPCKVCIRKR